MAQMLESIVVEPAKAAVASVIWLHGLGADGHDFEPVIPELRLPDSLPIRFIFPHAPIRPVTLNNGMNMRAWYDIISLDRTGKADAAGIRKSQAQLEMLIKHEIDRGIACHRIVLAGFSQGGAIALQTGLRYTDTLAGVMALSCYVPLPGTLESELSVNNRKTPVFMAHGTQDPVVPLEFGAQSRDLLLKHQLAVNWFEYPMAHSVCLEELHDIGRWLTGVLSD